MELVMFKQVNYNTWYLRVLGVFTRFFSLIHFNGLRALFNGGVYYSLKENDHDTLKKLLSSGYYVILTQRKSHLTTYLIGILSYIKTRKWPKYTHVLMNVDTVEDPDQWNKFRLMEATNSGVHWSTFMQVFDCDAVAILAPLNPDWNWDKAVEALLKQNGLLYDDLFDINDTQRVSCVELIRNSLFSDPRYKEEFKEFEASIAKVGNLTPQMFRDCGDFRVVFEVSR